MGFPNNNTPKTIFSSPIYINIFIVGGTLSSLDLGKKLKAVYVGKFNISTLPCIPQFLKMDQESLWQRTSYISDVSDRLAGEIGK